MSTETLNPGALDEAARDRLDAAAFRRLLEHLDAHKEVQNIDLMNLAGFCRNCLAKWYVQAAQTQGLEIADAAARERIYGMPYADWKRLYQKEATAEQQVAYAAAAAKTGH